MEMTDNQTSDGWRTGPLTDIRVLDLTQMLAGPYATMLLADLGADVVKIEPPSGDMTRSNPPHREADEAYGGYFNSVNRNKRGVVLDLKSESGRETFKQLVAETDVLVENFRVGTMDRLGLSYEELAEINPRLVYASIRGFGDPRTAASPYADRPAFDLIAQAMGGVMSVTGTEGNGPTKVGPGVGDLFPAVLSVVGTLSALHYRNQTGEGQYVDVSMVDGVLSLTERIVHQYSVGGDVPSPQGNTHPLLFPFNRFDAADGYVVIAAPADHQWSALCMYMDREDLADFDSETRVARSEELYEVVSDWTSEHTKTEIFEKLADDVPCGPVFTVEDIFEDEHFAARGMLPEVTHADTNQTVQLAGTPIKFTETPGGVHCRAPFLGEHTQEVLANFGLSPSEINEVMSNKE